MPYKKLCDLYLNLGDTNRAGLYKFHIGTMLSALGKGQGLQGVRHNDRTRGKSRQGEVMVGVRNNANKMDYANLKVCSARRNFCSRLEYTYSRS